MLKSLMMTTAAAALILMPRLATAADTSTMGQDNTFVTMATQGDQTEIRSSQMALDTSKNDQIKAFAKQMIADHKTVDDKVLGYVKTDKGIAVPKLDFDAMHQAEIDQLKNTPAANFDMAYLTLQDKEHKAAIMAFAQEASSGQNNDLKTLASQTLPTLKQHQQMLTSIESSMGMASNMGSGSMGSGSMAPTTTP